MIFQQLGEKIQCLHGRLPVKVRHVIDIRLYHGRHCPVCSVVNLAASSPLQKDCSAFSSCLRSFCHFETEMHHSQREDRIF